MHAMPKLGFQLLLSVQQLAFNHSFIVMFSLVLLPDLWHRCNYLAEKQFAEGSWSLLDFGMLPTSIKVSKLCHN